MQDGKKLKGWEKETSDIKIDRENLKKEIDNINVTIKKLQIEVERILKALNMKSYGDELRERMDKAEHRHSNEIVL
ncbi:MAG: hypothetical protein ACFFBC_02035 [Promethearchaeota archaeon]